MDYAAVWFIYGQHYISSDLAIVAANNEALFAIVNI